MQAILIRLLLGAGGQLLAIIFKALVQQRVFEEALALAQLEVAKLEGDTSADGDAKRKTAIEAVKAGLLAVGLTARDSIVSLAVELAVNALRAEAAK